jgi:hypothetical protein
MRRAIANPSQMADQEFEYRRVRHGERVLAQTLAGEAVLLDLKSERYFGLDRTGTRVWQLIDEMGDVQQIFAALVAEFDAPPQTIADDLRALLGRLVAEGLVQPDA